MTIRKGEPWGEPGALDPDAPVFDTDAAASEWLQPKLLVAEDGSFAAEMGLVGGDLHRTLGSPRHDEADLRAGRGMRFPVDVGVVEFEAPDGGSQRAVFLAHLVATADARGRWWHGRTVAVMNAAFVGDANLGPRAHPNDGRLDVTDGELSWGDRRRAASRAPAGAHVPHPALRERRVRELALDEGSLFHLRADGRDLGPARRVVLRCVPDAVTIVV